MDSNKIEELLEKYWSCETSLEEENALREYFSKENISPSLKDAAALFQFFQAQRQMGLRDQSFDKSTIASLTSPRRGRIRHLVFNAMRIAAGIVVLMVAVWFVRSEVRNSTPQEMVDTYDDPEMAFEETKRALMIISKSFGKVEDDAKQINLFNEAQQQIKTGEEPQEDSSTQL